VNPSCREVEKKSVEKAENARSVLIRESIHTALMLFCGEIRRGRRRPQK
jgi:hypothetical protein